MARLLFLIVITLLTGVSLYYPGLKIDKTESVFFPPGLGDDLRTYKSFTTFWWGSFIHEFDGEEEMWTRAHAACAALKSVPSLSLVECEQDLGRYLPMIKDWAGDYPRRASVDERLLKTSFNEALARLSLPMPKEAFEITRADPLATADALRALTLGRLRMPFERRNGFFFDDATKRILIPVLPSFEPSLTDESQKVAQALADCRGCGEWRWIGPHASTYENRAQITRDLDTVSWVGFAVLALYCLQLAALRLWKLLIQVPIVCVATLWAAVGTSAIYGSIHGLTLSFGMGIIGLIIDYGLHAAFVKNKTHAWRSNGLGFVTTVACLLVVMASAIPLMRQLMVFSVMGFATGFALLFLAGRYLPDYFEAKPVSGPFPRSRGLAMVGILFALGLLISPLIRQSFDLRQFDYQTTDTQQLQEWLFKKTLETPPLFHVHSRKTFASPLGAAHDELTWAREHNQRVESVALYLPVDQEQESHVESWKKVQCGPRALPSLLGESERVAFAPFLDRVACEKLVTQTLTEGPIPLYVGHLVSPTHWLTLWFPGNEADTQQIQAKYPDARSLAAVVAIFPATLRAELLWMAPLTFFLVWLLLFLTYRHLGYATLGLVPFLTGAGMTVWMIAAMGGSLSFISFVGLIMVLGLSVDYGVFVIDYFRENPVRNLMAERGLTTALWFAAWTTIGGFVPLAFCKHKVLADLGLTLSFGTLGTVLGAFWLVPWLMHYGARENR